MSEKKHKWIKKALEGEKGHPFKKAAEHAGKSTAEFASEHEHSKGKIGKEARLAKTLMHMKNPSGKSIRHQMYGKES